MEPAKDRLVPVNEAYVDHITKALLGSDAESEDVSLETITSLIVEQLSDESADIVIRRLVGQTVADISEQKNLATEYVTAVLMDAPRLLRLPEPEWVNEWMTIGLLAQRLKKSYDWVQLRVNRYFSHLGELRLDTQSVPPVERMYYPPEVYTALKAELDALKQYPIVQPEDISLNGLSVILKKDERWIKARKPYLDIEGTTKLNPVNNRLFEYYTEGDLELLKGEVERMDQYPVAGPEDVTANGLATLLKHDLKWVRRRLRYIVITPKIMMNPANNQLGVYYPKDETIRQIHELPNHIEGLRPSIVAPEHPAERPLHRAPLEVRVLGGKVDYVTVDNWREFSECATTDPEIFNPEKGGSTREAKLICGRCAARLFCLDYAIATNQNHGVWGGKTERERRAIRRGQT